MTAPFNLSIESLSLPVGGEAEAVLVAQSMTATLAQLHAQDMASGFVWREALGAVSLEVRTELDARETGQALAHHLRNQLAMREDAL